MDNQRWGKSPPGLLSTLGEAMDVAGLPAPIPLRGCRRPERLTGLLQDRLMDLAVLNAPADVPAASPLNYLPFITPAEHQRYAVLRQDLLEAPALQELLDLLKAGARA